METDIPFLKPGDVIRIVAPAKAIDTDPVYHARSYLESFGFEVQISANCLNRENYFSGSKEERSADFQSALDDPSVKAILCARGGYGSVQFIEELDWTFFRSSPKWIAGFSDITVFHQKIARLGFSSIHSSMPLNFKENTIESLHSLTNALCGKGVDFHTLMADGFTGKASGVLTGGNLSILYSLIGTKLQPDYNGTILFIEDLSEQLYHIDRIFHALELSGILGSIAGLIVGGMTDIKDTEVPFGMSLREIIETHVREKNIPVLFDFPAGHIDDNRALILGSRVELAVSGSEATLTYL